MASVQDITNQVNTRLKEISAEIAVLEKERTALTKVADTLGATASSSHDGVSTPRPTRRPSSRTARGASGRGRRRRATRRSSGSGGRAAETVQIVTRRPGVTVKEIAAEMGIKPNYLYRVLPALESEGKIAKRGTGYVPAGS